MGPINFWRYLSKLARRLRLKVISETSNRSRLESPPYAFPADTEFKTVEAVLSKMTAWHMDSVNRLCKSVDQLREEHEEEKSLLVKEKNALLKERDDLLAECRILEDLNDFMSEQSNALRGQILQNQANVDIQRQINKVKDKRVESLSSMIERRNKTIDDLDNNFARLRDNAYHDDVRDF